MKKIVPRPPADEVDWELRLDEVERPKSVTHGTLSALSSMFSGLRSRWMILCACTAWLGLGLGLGLVLRLGLRLGLGLG